MATAKEKKEEVKASLKILRAELRKMHLGVTEELALPEPTEVKKLRVKAFISETIYKLKNSLILYFLLFFDDFGSITANRASI